jgi:membrane associated rhomboid family serine protease
MAYQHHSVRDENPMTGTTRIVIACGVVFLGQMLTEPHDPRQSDPVSAWFGLDNRSPLELWRWFTYMFVHGDWRHLLFNMWALWIFGPMVERELGRLRFFKLYFLCGVLGAGAWLPFNPGPPEGLPSLLIGASAAICGVLATAAAICPHKTIHLIIPPIPVSVRTLAILLIGFDVLVIMISGTNTRVAHLAHLGGALGAGVYMREHLQSRIRQQRLLSKLEMAPMTHICSTCGITEKDDPHMLFRVCSKCANGEEYCEHHLRDHEHSAEA